MELAVLIICIVALALLILGILAVRQDLGVIHIAVNSNMTRALNEITQLHKDVTLLIKERNEARVATSNLQGRETLAGRLVVVVDDIAEQQKVVAADLAESHARADDVPHTAEAGEAADAASKLTKKEEELLEEED